ncbi:polysaccharide deacetylase family protein [Agrilactobacillus composti]|nr:polysaccharide deacetylase family protein [Agrilactobacillus composti]
MATFNTDGNSIKIINSGKPAVDNPALIFPYGIGTRQYKWVDGSPQGWYDRLAAGTYQQQSDTSALTFGLNASGTAENDPIYFHTIDPNYIIVDGWAFNDPLMLETSTNRVPFPAKNVNIYDRFGSGRNKVGRAYMGVGSTYDQTTMVNGVVWFRSGRGQWYTPHEYFNYDRPEVETSDAVAPGQADDFTIKAVNDTQAYDAPYIQDQHGLGYTVPAGTVSKTNGDHGIVIYNDMVWGQTPNGEWFTNYDIYQSGSGQDETFDRKSNPISFPVLAYHDFTDDTSSSDPYRMPFAEFEQQLDWLDQLGYTVVSMDTAYNMLKTNTNNIGKVVALTFDDGYGTWNRVADILKQHGYAATFFYRGDFITDQADTAQYLLDNGMTIGNHTINHASMNYGPYWNQWYAWNNAKSPLGQVVNNIDYCAYPGGGHNYLSPMACKNNDYKACFNYDNKLAYAFSSDFERYTLGRLMMEVGKYDGSIDEFADYLANGR